MLGRVWVLLLCSFFSFLPHAHAIVSPIGVSILAPVQLPLERVPITGARLSLLVGRHERFYGLDLAAIGNVTTKRFLGASVAGLFNWTEGVTTIVGLQFAGLANINVGSAKINGLQLALGFNTNFGDAKVKGIQLALLGNSAVNTRIYGAQIGLFNEAGIVYGVQIGLVNVAQKLRGLQIGLANFSSRDASSMLPFLNFGF
jgi:hypothetical protein